MDRDSFYNSAYKGTKSFKQQEVITANATGFGAAADDFMERGIDLNEQLIMNKPATFFFRMNSDAMEGACIHAGDILIVDRSIKAANGKIIVAIINGELMVRRYEHSFNKATLCAENKRFKDIAIEEFSQFHCWGVVTCVIHMIEPALMSYHKKASAEQEKSVAEKYIRW
ncbi:MAG: peptidase S24 [Chitinophaga sp.]|jgi:DNA polymerase V|nr:peptidase S24 [Chitinophaga sp.]